MISIQNLQQMAYNKIIVENQDIQKVSKIINGISSGKITKDNIYSETRRFTKNVTSDHSIGRWQIIFEWFDKQLNTYEIEL